MILFYRIFHIFVDFRIDPSVPRSAFDLSPSEKDAADDRERTIFFLCLKLSFPFALSQEDNARSGQGG